MIAKNALRFAAIASLGALGACTSAQLTANGIQLQPADPNVVAAIAAACQVDGIFKMVGGRLVLASIPYVGAADAIAAAGVDKVCANPAAFASDVSTAAWVAKNLTALIKARAG